MLLQCCLDHSVACQLSPRTSVHHTRPEPDRLEPVLNPTLRIPDAADDAVRVEEPASVGISRFAALFGVSRDVEASGQNA